MNNDRFDSVTRIVSSRRGVSGAIAGTVAGLFTFLGGQQVEAAPCPKGKRRCGKKCIPKRGCCTNADCKPRSGGQVCKRNRCGCPRGMKRCGKRCLLKAAACPPKPDASCPRPPASSATGYAFEAGERMAQTFTEPNGGRLTAVDLWLHKFNPPANGTFELRLGPVDPNTGTPLATAFAVAHRSTESLSDAEYKPIRFTFATPPRLRPGQQYALVLMMIEGTGSWVTENRTAGSCPGGTFFLFVPPGPWYTDPRYGLGASYRTFVKP